MTLEPVAVVGMACRLPSVEHPDQLWDLLVSGRTTIAPRTRARWPGDLPAEQPLPPASVLPDADCFDAEAFAMSPAEARATDPHQRLALEIGAAALESTSNPLSFRGSSTGVYVAASSPDWPRLLAGQGAAPSRHDFTACQRSLVADRLAHAWSFTGPSVVVDSGQSASLVALHQAATALRHGEVTAAVVGGVHLNLAAESTEAALRAGVLSPTGQPRVFDHRADGFVRGEGAVAVVLKPLAQALADGDHVHATILATHVYRNASGALLEPDPASQAAGLREVLSMAGTTEAAVAFVEAHGTGTPRGDRDELKALGTLFADRRSDPVPVVSVKAHVGHLEPAAGLVGLVRAILTLRTGTVTGQPGFERAAADVDLPGTGLCVPVLSKPCRAAESPVALVSSLGIGGSNACAVVGPGRTMPASAGPDSSPQPLCLPLSAATGPGLQLRARALLGRTALEADVRGVSAALQRLPAARHRAVVTGPTSSSAREGLEALAEGRPAADVVRPDRPARVQHGLALVFPGQGAQWRGMAAGLLRADDAFSAHVRRCDAAIKQQAGWSVLDLLATGAPLRGEAVVQPALFTVATALAEWWRVEARVEATAVVGHSQGEVAAAWAAGILGLDDAIRIVLARSTAVDLLPPTHGMLSVRLPEAQVRALLADTAGCEQVAVAAVSSPAATVVAGPLAGLDVVGLECERRGVRHRRVQVGYASHSSQVEAVRDHVVAGVGSPVPSPGALQFFSSVTGGPLDGGRLTSGYWWDNLRRPVRFDEAVEALLDTGVRTFLEVAAHPLLGTSIEETAAQRGVEVCVAGSLVRDRDDLGSLASGAARLWCDGVDLAWERVAGTTATRPVDLGPSPRVRTRHWPEGDGGPTQARETVAPASERAAPLTQAPPAAAPSAVDIETLVRGCVAEVLGRDDPSAIEPDATFGDLGLDSRGAVLVRDLLAQQLRRPLPVGFAFDHPSIARSVAALHASTTGARATGTPPSGPGERTGAVAVVGMAGRYAGAEDLDTLWQVLASGRCTIGEFPADRGWRVPASGVSRGGFLDSATRFDPTAFAISPREAVAMDPQQRVLLEVVREAFDRWGLDPRVHAPRTGVFVGAMPGTYGPGLGRGGADTSGYLLTGSTPSVIAGRVAYTFGFGGQALTVDTACSSSLVALDLARKALVAEEIDLAVVGGVCVMSDPGIFEEFAHQGGLSPDGICKAYGDGADGTGWSEGCGVVLLQRRSAALDQGVEVLAEVVSSVVNQDGTSNGLTAPSGTAQARLLRDALDRAGLTPADLDVVEGHGTGTRLGDPIEVQALAEVFGPSRADTDPLLLGSLKTNVGHSQAAAGIGGVIKMVLAMRHDLLPATLHAEEPTRHVDWPASGLALLHSARPWPGGRRPRRAGVSSFGISGTNAHVILQEPTAAPREGEPVLRPPLVLSAQDPVALRTVCGQVAAFLEDGPEPASERLGSAAAVSAGRRHGRHRLAVPDRGEAGVAALRAAASGTPHDLAFLGRGDGRLVVAFAGQGSQVPGMGCALHEASSAYRDTVAQACELLRDSGGEAAHALLLQPSDQGPVATSTVVQAALLAHGAGITAALREQGLRPGLALGHSAGEVNALLAAGGLSLEDACRLVVARARALEALPAGVMCAVRCTPVAARDVAAEVGGVDVAAVNAAHVVVLSGDPSRVRAAVSALGGRATWVNRENAFHSFHVDAVRDGIDEVAEQLDWRPTTSSFASAVTGEVHEPGWTPPSGYWGRHARDTVLFEPILAHVVGLPSATVLEVAGRPTLAPLFRSADTGGGALVLQVGDDRPGRLDEASAAAHARTGDVDASLRGRARRPRLATGLPGTALSPTRLWLETPPSRSDGRTVPGMHPWLDPVLDLPDGSAVVGGVVDPATGWLEEHQVLRRPVLPGAATLDLVLAFARETGCTRVEDLRLVAPVPTGASAPTELRLALAPPAPQGRRVQVHVRTGAQEPWRVVAHGTLTEQGSPRDAEPARLSGRGRGPRDEGGRLLDADALARRLQAHGVFHGPQLRRVASAWADGRVADVDLVPSPEPASCGVVDPRLLDSVLQVALHLALEDVPDEVVVLPSRWLDVTTHPGTSPVRARVAVSGRHPSWSAELVLLDASHTCVLHAVVELSAVQGTMAAGESVPALLAPATEEPGTPSDQVSAATTTVLLGEWPRVPAPPRPRPDPVLVDTLADLDAWWARGNTAGLVLLQVRRPRDEHDDLEVERVLGIVHEWLADPRARGCPLGVVTADGAHATWQDRAVEGLVRSVAREHPGVVRLIRRDPAAGPLLEHSWQHQVPELLVGSGGVALLPVLSVGAVPPVATVGTPFDPDRTVLVTGGSGALGRRLVRHLVDTHGVRHVVAASRRGVGAPGTAQLAADCEARGAELVVRSADVARVEDVQMLLRDIRSGVGLGAVVHLAGVAPDAPLSATTPTALRRALAGKYAGARLLDELTTDSDLTAFVMVSSITAHVGQAGQAAYGAANAALDHLARARRDRGLPGLSLAYGPWEAPDGMAGALTRGHVGRWADRGIGMLDDAAALALFDRAVRGDEPVVVAAALAPGASADGLDPMLRTAYADLGLRPGHDQEEAAGGSADDDEGSSWHPSGTVGLVRELAGDILRVDRTLLTEGTNLWELGLDSLTALELVDAVAARTGARLSSGDVFEAGTVAELARRVTSCGSGGVS